MEHFAAPLKLTFDSRVYAIDTLQKAALKFTSMASFDFRLVGSTNVEVVVVPLPELHVDEAGFTALFRTEVLDQHLRHVVAAETAAERNLILAYAFSNSKLITP